MSKKTFADSPVMQFITQPGEEIDPATAQGDQVSGDQQPQAPQTPQRVDAAAPTMQPRQQTPQPMPTMKVYRAKNAPERKSRRLQLLIKPSIYLRLAEIAGREFTSVNNLVEYALLNYLALYTAEEERQRRGE